MPTQHLEIHRPALREWQGGKFSDLHLPGSVASLEPTILYKRPVETIRAKRERLVREANQQLEEWLG